MAMSGAWLSGPQSTFDVKGPVAKAQLDLFMVTVWVTLVIFIIVGGVLLYATIKFRARSDEDEHAPPPPQGHGNPLVEMSLIIASTVCLVIIGIPTYKYIWYTYDVPAAQKADAYEVTAWGYQWWFKFEYPKEQIEGAGTLVTGNELVIPAGRPVRVDLRTVDVIHSFWVPKLAGKVDMIPNRPNHLWLQADEPGYFYGQCAEYCGESHAIMRFRVVALAEKDFRAWVDRQKKPARTVTAATAAAGLDRPQVRFASLDKSGGALSGSTEFDADPFAAWKRKGEPAAGEDVALIAQGRRLFQEKTCINCHTIRGHEGAGVTAPDLTHVGSRTTIAAGVLENTPERMHQWLKDPAYFKPGNKMYYGIGGMAGYLKHDESGRWVPNIVLTDREIDALVAYLLSLK